jgi:hypothetical protein
VADRERRNGTMEASTSSPNSVIGSIPTSRDGPVPRIRVEPATGKIPDMRASAVGELSGPF